MPDEAGPEKALLARVQDFARRAELVQVLLSGLVPATLDDLATGEQVRLRFGGFGFRGSFTRKHQVRTWHR